MKLFRIIITDLVGAGLLILSVLTGWLPGPGGIPLLVAGLGLLAINHEWAKQLLDKVKTHGLKLADNFFREHKVLMAVYDCIAIGLAVGGILILIHFQGFIKTISTVLFTLSLALFLGNRKRAKRIVRYFRKP